MRCPVCNKKLAEFVEGRAVILCPRCKEYRLLTATVEGASREIHMDRSIKVVGARDS